MSLIHAMSALRTLIRDPDDTSQVFRIIEALSGATSSRIAQRMRATAEGRRLLVDKPDITEVLADRDALRALPVGSLGHRYVVFCDAEGISADGLIEASEQGSSGESAAGEDEAYVGARMRDSHDLWHALTGYHGDLIGEAALLAFTFAQTQNRGVGFIVGAALLKAEDPKARRLIIDGFMRGRRAAWLPAVAWEGLLHRPVGEVRDTLRVPAPPVYEPFRSSDLRAEMAAS